MLWNGSVQKEGARKEEKKKERPKKKRALKGRKERFWRGRRGSKEVPGAEYRGDEARFSSVTQQLPIVVVTGPRVG